MLIILAGTFLLFTQSPNPKRKIKVNANKQKITIKNFLENNIKLLFKN